MMRGVLRGEDASGLGRDLGGGTLRGRLMVGGLVGREVGNWRV